MWWNTRTTRAVSGETHGRESFRASFKFDGWLKSVEIYKMGLKWLSLKHFCRSVVDHDDWIFFGFLILYSFILLLSVGSLMPNSFAALD